MEDWDVETRAWAVYLTYRPMTLASATGETHRFRFDKKFLYDEKPLNLNAAKKILAQIPHRDMLFMEALASRYAPEPAFHPGQGWYDS